MTSACCRWQHISQLNEGDRLLNEVYKVMKLRP